MEYPLFVELATLLILPILQGFYMQRLHEMAKNLRGKVEAKEFKKREFAKWMSAWLAQEQVKFGEVQDFESHQRTHGSQGQDKEHLIEGGLHD